MLNGRLMFAIYRPINPLIQSLDEIPDGLFQSGEALGVEDISEVHLDVMKDTLGTFVGELYLADDVFGSPHEPFVKSGFLLVEVLAGKVLLDAHQLDIFLVDIVAEDVDGDLEIHGVYLLIHFPI